MTISVGNVTGSEIQHTLGMTCAKDDRPKKEAPPGSIHCLLSMSMARARGRKTRMGGRAESPLYTTSSRYLNICTQTRCYMAPLRLIVTLILMVGHNRRRDTWGTGGSWREGETEEEGSTSTKSRPIWPFIQCLGGH